jgi:hypothetical protein
VRSLGTSRVDMDRLDRPCNKECRQAKQGQKPRKSAPNWQTIGHRLN